MVDCMIALPGQLFYSTQIPACLWFLSRDTQKSVPEYWNSDILWYSAQNIDNSFIGDTLTKITQEGLQAGSRIAPAGSALLLVRGSGLFNYIPIYYAKKPVAFNQDVKAIVPKEGIDPDFLHFWIEALRPKLKENIGITP